MYVTLAEAKRHLVIDKSFTDDDAYIASLVDVAEGAVKKDLDVKSLTCLIDAEGGLPSSVHHAILFLVGNLYANREPVAYTTVNKVDKTYDFLIALYRNYDPSN